MTIFKDSTQKLQLIWVFPLRPKMSNVTSILDSALLRRLLVVRYQQLLSLTMRPSTLVLSLSLVKSDVETV